MKDDIFTTETTPNPSPIILPGTGTTQNPALARLQSRMEGTPPELHINFHEVQVVAVSVGELLEGIAANPKHPKAQDFAKAIKGLNPNTIIGVEQPDLQAMIQNRSVQVHTANINGRTVRTKFVV